MDPHSLKATVTSITASSVSITLADGQLLTLKVEDTSKLSVGQSLWITVSAGEFDPKAQPKEVLNTIFNTNTERI